MTMLYDKTARKKATSLTINSDLLQQAKDLGLNISNCLEKTLEEKVREQKMKDWQEENKDAIVQYNKRIEQNGVFSDELRSF